MNRSAVRAAAFAAAFVFLAACRGPALRVEAVEYGTSLYPVDLLGTEAEGPYTRILWLFYIIHAGSRTVLVDTGMSELKDARLFAIDHFRPSHEALQSASLVTPQITDIVLTHSHIDHVGSIASFPNARLYIQQAELDYFEKTERFERFRNAMDVYRSGGRLVVLSGDAELLPGVKILNAGGHTPGSQAVKVGSGAELLITGDNCYFADACRKGIVLPALAAQEPERNRAFVESLRSFDGKIVTLHDPAILEEEKVGPGIYRIQY